MLRSLVVLASLLLASGCAAPSVEAESSAASELTAREGYTPIQNTRGGVYVSVAVHGARAYVGDNRDSIDVIDLASMRKTGSLDGRIPSESLSVSGDVLVACGMRDDQPLGWDPTVGAEDHNNYVLSFFDARTGRKDKEIRLRLARYLATSTTGELIDLPNMGCRYDAATHRVGVAFGHSKLEDEVVTFEVPSSSKTFDFRDIPGATRISLGRGANDNTVNAFSMSERGLTYAAGGYGIKRLATGASRATTLHSAGREHYVDLTEKGDVVYAVDHNGALRLLNADTGAELEAISIDDWLHGVAISAGYVVVIGRSGVFVTRDRW